MPSPTCFLDEWQAVWMPVCLLDGVMAEGLHGMACCLPDCLANLLAGGCFPDQRKKNTKIDFPGLLNFFWVNKPQFQMLANTIVL
jgi:hypothetical protein